MSTETKTITPPPNEEGGIMLAGYEGAKMAMWLFLATEILIFGGLFAAYVYFRSFEPQSFIEGSKSLYWELGATNTVVLLISSLTAALALDSIQRNNRGKMKMYIWITIACAMAFMVIKYIEYSGKCGKGFCPPFGDAANNFADVPYFQYGKFLPLYFMMTALHGIHVLVGMGIFIAVLIKSKQYSDYYYVHVENAALYWHLVDLIWIFLFPLLYLIG